MIRTVDLVIAGAGTAAPRAAVDALLRGRSVLVVLSSADARAARNLRRRLLAAAEGDGSRVTVVTNAEVVCVDGVDGVEAVVIRSTRTGRLRAVNASAFMPCG